VPLLAHAHTLRRVLKLEKRDDFAGHELRRQRPAEERGKLLRTQREVLLDLDGAETVPGAFFLVSKPERSTRTVMAASSQFPSDAPAQNRSSSLICPACGERGLFIQVMEHVENQVDANRNVIRQLFGIPRSYCCQACRHEFPADESEQIG
jgi:hypothetical protein